MNVISLQTTGLASMRQDDQMHDGAHPSAPWAGFAEIDRAIAENRLTAYRWKKAWADPLNRLALIGVIVVIVAGFSYLIGAGLGWW
jgi:hypothetical protein